MRVSVCSLSIDTAVECHWATAAASGVTEGQASVALAAQSGLDGTGGGTGGDSPVRQLHHGLIVLHRKRQGRPWLLCPS